MAIREMRTDTMMIEPRSRVSWGALFAGTILTLGLWMLLMVLGVALGLTAIDPNDRSIAGQSIFTGIWALVAPLVALFFGSWATARLAGSQLRWSGALHGAIVWALSSLVGFWVIASAVGAAASGVASLGGRAVSSAAQGAGNISLEQLGVSGNDLIGPINERLRAEGKAQVTAPQMEAAAKDALGTAVRQGRFDRQLFVGSLSRNTDLSRQDSEEIATRLENAWNERVDQAGGMLQGAQEKALAAADQTGKALWWVFGMMLLGLVSSVLGGLAGTAIEQREPTPLATEREVRP